MEENAQESSSESSISPKGKSPVMMIVVIVILVVLVGFGAYTFIKSKPAPSVPEGIVKEKQVETSPETSSTGAAALGGNEAASPAAPIGEQTITVNGSNFKFTPNAITAKKGQKVNIVFKNDGGNHNFAIKEFNVSTPIIQSGAQTTVSFTPDKAGSFQYYCSVGNHRAMGMWGTLTVTP